ncbi:hypothetical protein D3C80_1497310 [compost metagenome]
MNSQPRLHDWTIQFSGSVLPPGTDPYCSQSRSSSGKRAFRSATNSANCALTLAGLTRGLTRTSKKISVTALGKAGRSSWPPRTPAIQPCGAITPLVLRSV